MRYEKLKYYAFAIPPAYALRQFAGRVWSRLVTAPRDRRELQQSQPRGRHSLRPRKAEIFSNLPSGIYSSALADYLVEQYCSHRFDLCGTGWADSAYSSEAVGTGGYSYSMNLVLPADINDGSWLKQVVHANHFSTSKKLWMMLREQHPNYTPIDWQRDRKSGFRWDAREFHGDQIGKSRSAAGVDLVQAWELGRLQHLPQLALICVQYPTHRQRAYREIHSQVVDFNLSNPKGMGVNWSCTMDVAIRVSNLVLAYWILASGETEELLAGDFREVFTDMVYQHGDFIRRHLEYNAGNTGNHYLANLTGLLFAANFLQAAPDILAWESLAITELLSEGQRQFYPDGGHFEGATCYQALCTEMLIFSMALACNNRVGLQLPDWIFARTCRAVQLVTLLHGPTGSLVQFGDNDSGRLFRLVPHGDFMSLADARKAYVNLADLPGSGQGVYFDEHVLDYSGVANTCNQGTLEYQILERLSEGRLFPRIDKEGKSQAKYQQQVGTVSLPFTMSKLLRGSGGLRTNIQCFSYPDFGLYIFKSDRLFLAISAHTNPRQKLNLAHNHNDKLGIELYIDGQAILTDPGSYVYTPLKALRDQFRSVAAHNTIQVDGLEQNRFIDSFISYQDAHCQLLQLKPHSILLSLEFRGVQQLRQIDILDDAIRVTDSCSQQFSQCWNDFPFESVGYGKLRRRS